MKLSDFNYNLPKEKIAQHTVFPKSYSKLMVLKNDRIEHRRFYNIIDYLRKGDALVINTTKVSRVKFLSKKTTGASAEITLEEQIDDYRFKVRVVRSSSVKIGNTLLLKEGITAKVYDIVNDLYFLEFNKKILDYADKIGLLPKPPYIMREVTDKEYQTVYSKQEGSRAAPTAGLHFTKNLLRRIKRKGIKIAEVCLHVGYGTFLPIREQDFTKHKMQREYYTIDEESAKIINNRKGRLFVVGTTALRCLETASESKGVVKAGSGFSELFIYPGYRFKLNNFNIITNFHFPKSSLLLMISAYWPWKKLKTAYETAIKNNYRFFSLGDAMLLLKY